MLVLKVKRAALVIATAAVLLVGSSQAMAENPVHWTFDVTTYGENVLWDSTTAVDNAPQYDYSYAIATLKALVDMGLLGTQWVDMIPLVPAEDLSGSGSEPGPLPIDLANESFTYPDVPPYNVSATVHIYADASGYGHVSIIDIVLGDDPVFGFPILAVQAAGNVDITGVPEPISLLLFLAGGGLLVTRRH